MRLGVHVSGFGKIYEAPELAQRLGCDTMQIFSRSPQRWRLGFIAPKDLEEFKRRKALCGIYPVFIHIPYLINLASPLKHLYEASVEAYVEDILEAEAMGAEYLVTHMGSHKETSEEEGVKRLIAALTLVLEKTRSSKVGILLENTSGSGSWLGYDFTHQGRIIKEVRGNARLGLCLDTAHAYLAGYDLSKEAGLKRLLDEIDKQTGLSRIKLVHLNDARGPLGCHLDRHDHIGKGGIGLAGIKRIVNHPKLKDVPFILETPKDTENADKLNLARVRKLMTNVK